jgi:hypothetical protein
MPKVLADIKTSVGLAQIVAAAAERIALAR